MKTNSIADNERLKKFINDILIEINRFELWIETKKTPIERIPIVRRSIGSGKLRLIIAKYSMGYALEEIKLEYLQLLRSFKLYWLQGYVLMEYEGRELKQYLDYDDMLWMLSLGYLLKVPESDFNILCELISRDEVKDRIYNFIISKKLGRQDFNLEESYEFGWNLYPSLREALVEEDLEKIFNLISVHLNYDWRRDHMEFLKLQNGRHGSYFGNWSFEAAAFVAIKGLDDRSFRINEYYPSTLVDFFRASS